MPSRSPTKWSIRSTGRTEVISRVAARQTLHRAERSRQLVGAAEGHPDSLPTHHLKTARAYQIRLAFQDLYEQPSTQTATAFLKKWYFWATHSRLEPMIEAAHTIKRHWDGILRWFDSKIANGLIEGINSLVQAAKAKARGYRTTRNLKAIVYLLAGKLDLRLPA